MKMSTSVGVYTVEIEGHDILMVLATNMLDAVDIAWSIADKDEEDWSSEVTQATRIGGLDHRAAFPSASTIAWVCANCGVEVEPKDPEITADVDGYWCAACQQEESKVREERA